MGPTNLEKWQFLGLLAVIVLFASNILADPRRADAKDLLNRKIKRRESFRPFAPSILREFTDVLGLTLKGRFAGAPTEIEP